jgi:hypothetical protein
MKLNQLYLSRGASAEDVALLFKMPAGNDPTRACHVTSAALTWALCGMDAFPPYSLDFAWVGAPHGWGQGVRVVAGSHATDELDFDADHVAVVVGDQVFDSWWQKSELSVHTAHDAQASTSFAGYKSLHHQSVVVDGKYLKNRIDMLLELMSPLHA